MQLIYMLRERKFYVNSRRSKRIGIRACINKLGYDFCKMHADNGVSAYGEEDGYVNCFVGVSDALAPECDINKVNELILTSGKKWPYAASCNVYLENGEIEFLEHRVPVK